MRWIKYPKAECPMYSDTLLGLSTREVAILARVLRKQQGKCRKRWEHFNDIHESGEATERQETLRLEAEDELSVVDWFIEESM